MSLFQLLPSITIRWRRPAPLVPGRLVCSGCQNPIHKHDKYIIERARHRDCNDPRQTGQARLPLFPEPAGDSTGQQLSNPTAVILSNAKDLRLTGSTVN